MSDTPAPALEKDALALELQRHLAEASRLRQMRLTEAAAQDHLRLKGWQSARLARTHADLAADPRYAVATAFFLDELYGTHDFTQRDAELARVLPTLVATLPTRALATLVDAMHMDALSESLDADMVVQLRAAGRAGRLDGAAYASAYRACSRPEDRALQIGLVGRIGRTLDRLTHLPLLGLSLKMMRRPAELAGLGELHRFLQQGFDAFRSMHGAEVFLALIEQRETALMQQIFAGGEP
ncbi:FFLEELY motif protein [Sphaerotilus microaerophilus]|uniref:DUF8198 domain-containing protein n=1 Tax=Sphaerotilus microaerophilus TaxID=2914710 RepID=A0ABM7YM06_9BURK|nr:hypothetical protein [Sphaerotilus sp. FB-5]BDI05481.1 hypothetical protein CATMQ487_24510 [Sphaerotilus sp. FB-5]